MKRLRRSFLFMPGDSLKKISKAAQMDVDCIVMDLEDGVALPKKEEARQTILQAFAQIDFGGREALIRTNPPTSAFFQDDLLKTIGGHPDGYVIPKVEDPYVLKDLAAQLSLLEAQHGWPHESLGLFALIETAKGIVQLPAIAASTSRLRALVFGAEDLAGDIGAERTSEGWEVFYARSAVVTVAAAFSLDAIDTIHAAFQDAEGLERECSLAKKLGYKGKIAIHPAQVEVIHRVFSPSPSEIHAAQRLVDAWKENQSAGFGAFSFEGKMIDMPMIRSAQHILDRARRVGSLPS